MKTKLGLLLLLGLAISLLAGGCESLRPPSQERAASEYEQQQQQAKPSPQEENTEDWLYWIAYDLGSVFAH